MKRILSAVISVSMIASNAIGLNINSNYINALEADGEVLQGNCGDDASWLINSDGVLVISGNGKLNCSGDWGWMRFNTDINEVVIENGITSVVNNSFTNTKRAFGYPYCDKYTKIIFPPSMTHLYGCLYDNIGNYPNLKDVYVYSKNILDAYTLYNPGFPKYFYANSGIIWHVYKGSQTEKSLREGLHLTDSDIEYIPDDEEMPLVTNKEPVIIEPLTDKSGPSGLFSKWEWDETSSTLTFSGKGAITILDDYKKYAEKTEHIVMNSGITLIENDDASNLSGAFVGFTVLKDIELPDTLKEIKDYSFYQTPITQITLPEGVEILGEGAFKNSKLEEISFSNSLNEIGESAFSNTDIKSINLHSGMYIQGSAFSGCKSINEVTIPKNVRFGKTIKEAQGMAGPHATFSNCTGLKKVTIEDGCEITDTWGHVLSENGLGANLCADCTSLKTVIIGGNVDYIPSQTFGNCSSLSDMYFYTPDLSTIEAKGQSESIDSNSKPTYYVIKDSKTETTLRNAGYLTDDNVVYIAGEDDINELKEAIEKSETFDTNKCTEDYTKKFTDAVSSGKEIIDKYDNDKYSGITLDKVNNALNVLENPEYIPSNYTSVEEAIAKADKLDLSKYTDESVKALKDAIAAVSRDLDITDQDKVDAFAKAIEDAIKGLVEKKPNTSNNNSNKPNQTISPTNNKKTNPSTNKVNVPKPAKVKSVKLTTKKKKLNVKWKKVSGATGYEVMYAKNNKFTKGKKTVKVKKNKVTLKRLKSKKKYFVKVRAYKTINGNTSYGKWSKVVKKKVK